MDARLTTATPHAIFVSLNTTFLLTQLLVLLLLITVPLIMPMDPALPATKPPKLLNSPLIKMHVFNQLLIVIHIIQMERVLIVQLSHINSQLDLSLVYLLLLDAILITLTVVAIIAQSLLSLSI
jgi:hypothetical protein